MLQADIHEGLSKPANKSSPVPRRSPPPPPTTSTAESSRNEGGGGPMGAFWTTQHAKESAVVEELNNKVKFDEEPSGAERFTLHRTSPPKNEGRHSRSSQKMVQGKSGPSKDFEMNFFPEAKSNDGFNAFASEFGMNRVGKEEELEGEVERLREQLKQVNMEKNELSSKYEKLSAICRSQRQELHELKQTLASTTPSPNKTSSKTQPSPGIQHHSPSPQKEKDGRVWEVEKGLFDKGSPVPSSEQNSWQAFPEENPTNNSKSVRTRNGHQNKQAAEGGTTTTSWGFGAESFTAVPAAASSQSQVNTTPNISTPNSGRSGYGEEFKNKESKSASRPAGWAGF
ncbi:unnamed protein product [Lactuca saligna]|nr:unnamed protein product [Lactuca saligna]